MIQVSGSYQDHIQYLISEKRNFTLRKTSGTAKIVEEDGTETLYYKDFVMTNKDFGFITQLKAEIRKSKAFKELCEAMDAQGTSVISKMNKKRNIKACREEDKIIIKFGIKPLAIRYFEFSKALNEIELDLGSYYEYDNVVECDITKAYYYSALEMGVIGEAFFKRCLDLPKSKRLRMMGSIATNTIIYEYRKGKVKECFVKNDKYMRCLWFAICGYVDQCMLDIKNIIAKDDFLFYWVDGIYFRQTDAKATNKMIDFIMRKYGFDYVIRRLKKITVTNEPEGMRVEVFKEPENTSFLLPKHQVKGYYLGDPLEGVTIQEERIYV